MLYDGAALGEENALQGGDLDSSTSKGDTSGAATAATSAAAVGPAQGEDPDSVAIPEEVEEILGEQPSVPGCARYDAQS